jgi:hypothetical protein
LLKKAYAEILYPKPIYFIPKNNTNKPKNKTKNNQHPKKTPQNA